MPGYRFSLWSLAPLSLLLILAACDNPRTRGWEVMASVIQPAPERPELPVFLNWLSREEIKQYCGYLSGLNTRNADSALAVFRKSNPPRLDFAGALDVMRSTEGTNRAVDAFRHDPVGVARLCDAALPGLRPLISADAIATWEKLPDKPVIISPPFPEDSKSNHSQWIIVLHPDHLTNPEAGTSYSLRDRPERGEIPIGITVPDAVASHGCPAEPSQKYPTPANRPVEITAFYYKQLCQPDEIAAASAAAGTGAHKGDFAVLVGFHLSRKERGNWLWLTAWWSLQPEGEFGRGRPRNLKGAGGQPEAWRNYVIDATDDYTGIIYNPLIQREQAALKSNCMACHQRAHYGNFEQSYDRTLLTSDQIKANGNTLLDFVFFPVVLEQDGFFNRDMKSSGLGIGLR